MKLRLSFVVFALYFISVLNCMAFDTETHALITRQAFKESMLTSPNFTNNWGVSRLNVTQPFHFYWNSTAGSVPFYFTQGTVTLVDNNKMYAEDFERCQMREFLLPRAPEDFHIFDDTVSPAGVDVYDTTYPLQNWVVRGAIREDDVQFKFLGPTEKEHCAAAFKESDQGSVLRSLGHFYDPTKNPPSSGGLLGVGTASINWGLGYVDSFAVPLQKDPLSMNHFSYEDARDMAWYALTYETTSSPGSPLNAAQRQTDAGTRLSAWATAFRSLGDVMHLVEDTGQPQHTRNDPHAAINSVEQQAFEDYTNDRVLGTTDEANGYVRGFFGEIPFTFTPPPLGNYPVVIFTTPLRYFTTRSVDGTDVQTQRAGLADFTNRTFFTGGTLPDQTSEPLPPHPFDTSYGLAIFALRRDGGR